MVWFKKWIQGRRTLQQLSEESSYSVRTLKRYFHEHLKEPPMLKVYPSQCVNLLIDGTYFRDDLCLIVYRDHTVKFTQLYRLSNGEWYEELKEDLQNLLILGVQIESITCDGHKALLKAIKKVCKHVITQRCLVHIQRMCLVWLRQHPKTEAGIELRRIVSRLHLITTALQRDYWIVNMVRWHERYESFINEKSYHPLTGRYWYRHKYVRRSFMVIKKALPDMFHYLDNHRIPKSTNGLESFFGHLKGHINIHRGLTLQHRKNFIKWYLHLRNGSAKFSEDHEAYR